MELLSLELPAGLLAINLSAIRHTLKHQAVAPSGKPNPSLNPNGVHVRPVSHTNHASLMATLCDVRTVINIVGSKLDAVRRHSLQLPPRGKKRL